MEVKDSLDSAHLTLGGRGIKKKKRGSTHQQNHHGRDQHIFLHSHALIKSGVAYPPTPPEDIRRIAIAPSKTRRRTPAGIPASPNATQALHQAALRLLRCSQ